MNFTGSVHVTLSILPQQINPDFKPINVHRKVSIAESDHTVICSLENSSQQPSKMRDYCNDLLSLTNYYTPERSHQATGMHLASSTSKDSLNSGVQTDEVNALQDQVLSPPATLEWSPALLEENNKGLKSTTVQSCPKDHLQFPQEESKKELGKEQEVPKTGSSYVHEDATFHPVMQLPFSRPVSISNFDLDCDSGLLFSNCDPLNSSPGLGSRLE